MKEVFVVSDNILSPLGDTTTENFKLLREGVTGIGLQKDAAMSAESFYASLLKTTDFFLRTPRK